MEDSNHRIAFAYYLPDWQYGGDEELLEQSEKITPMEFRAEMRGSIFCPSCKTPLSRSPNDKDVYTNSRTAHFKHLGSYKKVRCELRVKKSVGLNYETEEEVRQAIQNERLVIVSGWLEDPPENLVSALNEDAFFNQTSILDLDGPDTELPLGRHTGRKFSVPSKITSVLAICRNFDSNLSKAYFFPDSQYASLLSDRLFSVNRISSVIPRSSNLYFGKIVRFVRLDRRNIIYVEAAGIPELKIYTWPTHDERKLIDDKSIGRTILFFVSLDYDTESPSVRYKIMQWGQYSLLPTQYERFLRY